MEKKLGVKRGGERGEGGGEREKSREARRERVERGVKTKRREEEKVRGGGLFPPMLSTLKSSSRGRCSDQGSNS